ncbi:MAG TPA: phosphoribosylglycinamide formyltransferase [Actinomycetota bacterium]|nr:phosphoribosylglycinamide formyltransferase [Actinomycetota bacterium]
MDARIAVLASGAGSNLQALLDDAAVGSSIVLAVSDNPGAFALERARARGVRAVVLEPSHYGTRWDHDVALEHLLEEEGVEYVLLAGYMRILGPNVVRAFEGRVLNVHPALLPAFPGAHSVRDALEWGVGLTGATVHLVDEHVDHGPIVLQEAVAVLDDDDERSLHARIQEVEHRLFPLAARLLVEGRLRVDGRHVRVLAERPVSAAAGLPSDGASG